MHDKLRITEVDDNSDTRKGTVTRDHIKISAQESDRSDQRQASQNVNQLHRELPKHQEMAETLRNTYRTLSKNMEVARAGTFSPDLLDDYNHVVDMFNKKRNNLVALNDEIKKYNITRPEVTSEVELLKLPKQLKRFDAKANGGAYRPEGTAEVEKKRDLLKGDLKHLNAKYKAKPWKVAHTHRLGKAIVALLALTSGFHATNAQLNHALSIDGPSLLRNPIQPVYPYYIISPLNYRNRGTNWEDMKKAHSLDTPSTSTESARKQEKPIQPTSLIQQELFKQYKLHQSSTLYISNL